MSDRPLVIIHGWSDSYVSFKRLGRLLQAEGVTRDIRHVHLGNYLSLDDAVTFTDLREALARAWAREGLPTAPRSVDAVVHSTGGLVIRDWLSHCYAPDAVPLHHLLMLAPANFGSPLAHKGRSFLGRVVKGWKGEKPFQTGTHILKGLELASPFSWALAERDRFGARVYYGPGRVLCTVLVGNTGYSGISAAANEDGSDGTVRVSTANLNGVLVEADFTGDPEQPVAYRMKQSRGATAFGIMAGENHSTVAAKDGGPSNPSTLPFITRALTVTDADFPAWCAELDTHSAAVTEVTATDDPATHGYQNTVFLLQDQYGDHVDDYFLEFYVDDDDAGWFAGMFHRDAIRTVHTYGDDRAYRSVYVDCTTLFQRLDKFTEEMRISLTAMPEFRLTGSAGYRTWTDDDIGSIRMKLPQVRKLFQANRTVLVRTTIRRHQADRVFEFKPV